MPSTVLGVPEAGTYKAEAKVQTQLIDLSWRADTHCLRTPLTIPQTAVMCWLPQRRPSLAKNTSLRPSGFRIGRSALEGSGGAYTTLQIADAFPGLFDGVQVMQVFPDALSLAIAGLDAHLLMHYYLKRPREPLSEEQEVAIGGYSSLKAMTDAANQAARSDPISGRPDMEGYQSGQWRAVVPAELRYDPVANPRGARPTIFDTARNVYGADPATGAALRPFDNVGVQYGLSALNTSLITPAQFLDLNEAIGGVDSDGNYISARTTGDAGAIRRAYQSGLSLSGAGGLSAIPIVDNATSNEAGSYHYGWFHFAFRERIRQTDGTSANLMMWRSITNSHEENAIFDRWMNAWKADTSNEPQRDRVVAAKPPDAVDGCFDGTVFLADSLPFSSQPISPCSKLYPVYSNARYEAGGPLAANVLKVLSQTRRSVRIPRGVHASGTDPAQLNFFQRCL